MSHSIASPACSAGSQGVTSMQVIDRSLQASQYWPGLYALFGMDYERLSPIYPQFYDSKPSEKAFEEFMTERAGLMMAMMQPPPTMEEEFQDWYDTEHFPERENCAGFDTAARYIDMVNEYVTYRRQSAGAFPTTR